MHSAKHLPFLSAISRIKSRFNVAQSEPSWGIHSYILCLIKRHWRLWFSTLCDVECFWSVGLPFSHPCTGIFLHLTDRWYLSTYLQSFSFLINLSPGQSLQIIFFYSIGLRLFLWNIRFSYLLQITNVIYGYFHSSKTVLKQAGIICRELLSSIILLKSSCHGWLCQCWIWNVWDSHDCEAFLNTAVFQD